MKMSDLQNDPCFIGISELYSLENISTRYYLTSLDLVLNTASKRYCAINLMQNGYPYVTLLNKIGEWKKVTLHKIIALARIKNEAYEEIEHMNDNPLDLRYSNLLFSTHKENMRRAFVNDKRDCPSRKFEVVLLNGEMLTGSMKEIAELTGIPRITLYDRLYKGPLQRKRNTEEQVRRNMLVYSVREIEPAPEQKYMGNRSIDYRKGRFRGTILFENFSLEIE